MERKQKIKWNEINEKRELYILVCRNTLRLENG